jgi:ribosomal protein L39E
MELLLKVGMDHTKECFAKQEHIHGKFQPPSKMDQSGPMPMWIIVKTCRTTVTEP